MKKLTPSFLFLTLFILLSGEYLLCAMKMAKKQGFLTEQEVASCGKLAIIIAIIFLFVTLFSMTFKNESKQHLICRLGRVFFTMFPIILVAEIISLLYPKFLEQSNITDIKKWFIVRIIAAVIALLVVTAMLFTTVNDITKEGKIGGVLKGVLRLITHPLHFILFIILTLVSIIMTEALELVFTYVPGINIYFSFYVYMAMYLIDALLATAFMCLTIKIMEKKASTWNNKSFAKKAKKQQKSTPNIENGGSVQAAETEVEEKVKLGTQLKKTFSILSLVISVITLVACVVMAFFVNKTEEQSNSDKFLKDIDVSIAAGVSMLSYGQLNEAQKYYNYAQVCIDAYNDYMNDDVYALADLAEKYPENVNVWAYYTELSDSYEELEKYIIEENPFNDELKSLLIQKYSKSKKLTKKQKAYREEFIRDNISEMNFTTYVADAVTASGEKKRLSKKINDKYDVIGGYVKCLKFLNDTGKNGYVYDVVDILDIADEYPDEVYIQYLAGTAAAAGVTDHTYYYDQAITIVNRFVRLSEDDKNISENELILRRQRAANLLVYLKDYTEAENVLDDIDLEKYPDKKPEILIQKLYCADCKGKSEQCYELAKELLDEGQENAYVYYFYGVGALKEGDKDITIEAINDCSKFLCNTELSEEELLKNETAFYTMLEYAVLNDSETWTQYQYGFYGELEDEKKDYIEDLPYYFMEALDLYYNVGDYEAALENINEVLEIRDDLSYAWYLKGAILYSLEEYEDSAESYENAIELNPDHPTFLYALACTYDASGDYKKAYEASGKSADIVPTINHEQDWYGLGVHNVALYNRLADEVEVDEEETKEESKEDEGGDE